MGWGGVGGIFFLRWGRGWREAVRAGRKLKGLNLKVKKLKGGGGRAYEQWEREIEADVKAGKLPR